MQLGSRNLWHVSAGSIGAVLAVGAIYATPQPWNWIPVLAVAILAARDFLLRHERLEKTRVQVRQRRLALTGLTLVLLACATLRRAGDVVRPQSWPAFVQSSATCGVGLSCMAELEGYSSGDKKLVRGMFQVLGQRDGGLIVDDGGRHWWGHPRTSRQPGAAQFVVRKYRWVQRNQLKTRAIEPSVEGLTLVEVGDGILAAANKAPDPVTQDTALEWQATDIRVAGECVLESAVPTSQVVPQAGIRIQGKRIILEYAGVYGLTACNINVPIKEGSLRIILPAAIPDPDLKSEQLFEQLRN